MQPEPITRYLVPSPPKTPLSALAPYQHSCELSVNNELPRSVALSILAQQQGLTPAKARLSPQVSALRKADEDGVAEALSNLLIFTAAQFNCVRNLTDTQIMLLSQDLPVRYWHWRIDEFAYVFREAAAGRWGKVYDRLDPPTVQEWCATYETQVRGEQVAAEAESRAAGYKAAEADTGPPTDMARAYLRAQLETKPDEELQAGISYYLRHSDAPAAGLKKQLAEAVLADREKARQAGPSTEQAEAGYQRFKADFIARQVIEDGPPEA